MNFKKALKMGFFPICHRMDGIIMVKDKKYFIISDKYNIPERIGKLHDMPEGFTVFTGRKLNNGWELSNSGKNTLKW